MNAPRKIDAMMTFDKRSIIFWAPDRAAAGCGFLAAENWAAKRTLPANLRACLVLAGKPSASRALREP